MGEHCAWCGDGERLKYGVCTSVVEINTRKLPLFGNESICSLLSSPLMVSKNKAHKGQFSTMTVVFLLQ